MSTAAGVVRPTLQPAADVARSALLFGCLMAVGGCSGEATPGAVGSERPGQLTVWTLTGPDLELGEFEGGGDQTFDLVAGVALLGEDRIAVVDQGSADVRVYDGTGSLVETFGGEGDGPGEFRAPADIRVLGGDSIQVLDAWDQRVTLLTPDFGYVREFAAVSPLAGRYLLEGTVAEAERHAALAVLAGRPFPVARTGFRLATLSADGRVWIRERLATEAAPALWFVLGPDGTPIRAVEVPHRFRPMYLRDDLVIGRWRGEYDVHYVRWYRLESAGRTTAAPDWLTGPASDTPAPPMPDSVRRGLQSIVRNAATMQEVYYSNQRSYSTRVDSLMTAGDRELPEGLGMDVLHATARGWSMILTSAGHAGMCALRYGRDGPQALRSGAVICTN